MFWRPKSPIMFNGQTDAPWRTPLYDGSTCVLIADIELLLRSCPMSAANMPKSHYNNVKMGEMASQITSLAIVNSTFYSGADQKKHRSSASLAFVRVIHRWPVNSQHKGPVTRKIFPFGDIIMMQSLIARFMEPEWGPPGADRTQVDSMLAPWTLLTGMTYLWLNTKEALLYY